MLYLLPSQHRYVAWWQAVHHIQEGVRSLQAEGQAQLRGLLADAGRQLHHI
jgi:hypothetical protein